MKQSLNSTRVDSVQSEEDIEDDYVSLLGNVDSVLNKLFNGTDDFLGVMNKIEDIFGQETYMCWSCNNLDNNCTESKIEMCSINKKCNNYLNKTSL